MIMKNEDFNIKNAITELQGLGICLRVAVQRLPSSAIKQYLLYVVTKPIEISEIADFYQLRNRISSVLDVVTQEGLNDGEEVLQLLRTIKKDVEKIVSCIKVEGKF